MGFFSKKPRIKPVAMKNSAAITDVGKVLAKIAAVTFGGNSAFSGSANKAQTLMPISTLQSKMADSQSQYLQAVKAQPGISEAEAIKLATFRAVAESSAFAASASNLIAPVKALVAATSPVSARQAQAQLLQAVVANHQQAQVTNFRIIAMNAFRRIGFTLIEELPGSNEKLRLAGRDTNGRTLITEFETNAERGESIASEVLGVCHSQSEELLEAFEKALEEEGVIGQPPTRKRTGGVAELEATREFIRRPVTKTPLQTSPKKIKDDRRQIQQNNQRSNHQRHR